MKWSDVFLILEKYGFDIGADHDVIYFTFSGIDYNDPEAIFDKEDLHKLKAFGLFYDEDYGSFTKYV